MSTAGRLGRPALHEPMCHVLCHDTARGRGLETHLVEWHPGSQEICLPWLFSLVLFPND